MSVRTKELKGKYIHKVVVSRREEGKRSELGYRPEVRLCRERSTLTDSVDTIARGILFRSQEEMEKFTDLHGTPLSLAGSVAGVYGLWGRKTGAAPDGRKNKESLADGDGSPMTGGDKNGPTAVLKSLSKISPPSWPTLVNQKFLPQFLEGENRIVFAQYLNVLC